MQDQGLVRCFTGWARAKLGMATTSHESELHQHFFIRAGAVRKIEVGQLSSIQPSLADLFNHWTAASA